MKTTNDYKAESGEPLTDNITKVMQYILDNGVSSNADIAKATGCLIRTVRRCTASLESAGNIVSEVRAGVRVYGVYIEPEPVAKENARLLPTGGVEIKEGNSRKILLTEHRHVMTDTIGRRNYGGTGGGTSIDCAFNLPK